MLASRLIPLAEVADVPFGIGIWQLVIVLAIILLVFGARRLPEIGRSLGSSAREFKQGIGERDERQTRPDGDDERS